MQRPTKQVRPTQCEVDTVIYRAKFCHIFFYRGSSVQVCKDQTLHSLSKKHFKLEAHKPALNFRHSVMTNFIKKFLFPEFLLVARAVNYRCDHHCSLQYCIFSNKNCSSRLLIGQYIFALYLGSNCCVIVAQFLKEVKGCVEQKKKPTNISDGIKFLLHFLKNLSKNARSFVPFTIVGGSVMHWPPDT
jgi:hypothetical protein